jgi:hypothetical protein
VTLHDALSQAWTKIRKETVAPRMPDVPDVAIGVGNGPLHVTDWDNPVLVPQRIIDQGSGPVLAFLLHQAAHSLVREPASARYHSVAFKQAAERVGLAVEYAGTATGWSDTSLTPELERIYAAQLAQLDAAATGQRSSAFTRNGITACCPAHPDFTIRIRGADAAERLQAHPLRCALCDVELIMMPGR